MSPLLLRSALTPVAVLATRLMLFKRAAAPTAVLLEPVVLNKSASAPNAVFSSGVFKRSVTAPVAVLKGRQPANCRVHRAGRDAKKGFGPFCRGAPGIARLAQEQPLALLAKAQCRQFRSECELSFEVSCLVFSFLSCPRFPPSLRLDIQTCRIKPAAPPMPGTVKKWLYVLQPPSHLGS